MVENAVYRYKTIIGSEMRAERCLDSELSTGLVARFSTR